MTLFPAIRTSPFLPMSIISQSNFFALTEKIITQAREHKLCLNHILTIVMLRDLTSKIGMKVMASKIKVTDGAMTGISNDLVRRGLLVREHNLSDRRKIMLSLTERGKQVADFIMD